MPLSGKWQIWNRAAMESGGTEPRKGDRALADLLLFHGYVMNGGLSHGFELSPEELATALAGFRFFGFSELAEFLERIAQLPGHEHEKLSREYRCFIRDDGVLTARFEDDYSHFPEHYAPLGKS